CSIPASTWISTPCSRRALLAHTVWRSSKETCRFLKLTILFLRRLEMQFVNRKSISLVMAIGPRLVVAVLAGLAILVGVSCPVSYGQDIPGSSAESLPRNYVNSDREDDPPALRSRVVAVGIPGASAISAVGTFLPGGPIHDKPEFRAFTQPGRILDPIRILVGS